MRRLALLSALTLAAAPALADAPPAHSDGQPNRYRLEIDATARRATVEASLWLSGNLLSMFNVAPVPGLPNGTADLIEALEVEGADGALLPVESLGQGDFELPRGGRVKVRYRVRLEHDRYAWPAGAEEVAYPTDEGWMATGATLLLADGGDAIVGPIEVAVSLPAGWRAVTPWPAAASGAGFAPASRRELLSNALFFGTAATERVAAGGVELTLLLGRRYRGSAALFADLLRSQLATYRELFGADPQARRFLVVVNEGASGDGGAFASSFSQLIAGDADEASRLIWGYTMAHELLHFWNGLSLVPADSREEWFKEGATDYLTIATLARNGWIDEATARRRLENAVLRVLLARRMQGLEMSVREAGERKQEHRLLVYGGGCLAAMALDVELRRASGDRAGLPELVARLFAGYAQPGARYELADIVRAAREVAGADVAPLLERAVGSGEPFDIVPYLAGLGLRLDTFAEEVYIRPEARAAAADRARFAAVFGKR